MTTATAVAEAPPPAPLEVAEEAAASAPVADGERDASVAVDAVARRWASLLSAARAESQAAFLLKQVGACPRCCLRFAGVRDSAAYAPPAPSSESLLAALVDERRDDDEKTPTTGDDAPPPCSVCLGVLQAPDGALELPLPSERMVAAAAAVDMGAGEWFPLSKGDGATVAGVVEREGHCRRSGGSEGGDPTTSPFCPPPLPRVVSLQVSFPASVGLRQASASAALADAGLPPAKPTGGGGSLGPDSITDVKDALKASVAPLLSATLSRGRGRGGEEEEVAVTTANDADAAALTVSMMFVHPPTSGEVDAVPGLAGKGKRSRGWAGGRGKSVFVVEERGGGGGENDGASLPPGDRGRWKKRKRVPAADAASLGRAASQAVTQACSRLDGAKLRAAGVAVPPARLPPTTSDGGDGKPSSAAPHLLVRARASPLFLGGRYLKLERDVSQSPFFDERGQRRGRTSVQEEIERHVVPLFGEKASGGGCDGIKFITAGREDLDVRCLGRGRPFILEVSNARLGGRGPPTREALDGARERLRSSRCGVELAALAVVGRKELSAIKEGESVKQKSYEALCWLPREVDDGVIEAINSAVARANGEAGASVDGGKSDDGSRGLVLKQTTPSRVEHRRAMLVRERSIVEMSARRVEGETNQVLLRLRTQAGLYVKEFVHGDGGRTTPSLVDVACSGGGGAASEPAKCLSLDVCEVHLDFL